MEIGSLFREFRLNKHLKLNQTAEGIVTTQFLRKFEKNESDISTGKFFALLQRINVTVEEFSEAYFQQSNIITIDKLEKQLDEIAITKSKELWNKILKTNQVQLISSDNYQKKFTEFTEIIIKSYGNRLFDESFIIKEDTIIAYLESIETWGKSEFFLANYISFVLNTDGLIKLWNLAFSKKMKSTIIQRYSTDFYLHVCMNLIKLNQIQETKKLLAFYEKYQQPKKILQNLSYFSLTQFLKGVIMILEGNEKGIQISQSIINFFQNTIEFEEYADTMENYLNMIILERSN